MIYLEMSPFMQDYISMMDKLITEKPSSEMDRNKKIQELFDRTIGKVEIRGEEKFIESMKGCLHSLCEIKPGRT